MSEKNVITGKKFKWMLLTASFRHKVFDVQINTKMVKTSIRLTLLMTYLVSPLC